MKGTIAPPRTEEGRPPARPGRIGGWLSLAGGALLAGLMVYVLAWEWPGRRIAPTDDAAGVAVVFPDREDWDDFRAGARAVADRGLARVRAEDDGAITLETPRAHRRVRFTWHGVGGEIETREEVRRLVESPAPPAAVVGSANSVLTAALADALRASAEAGGPAPVLLVPWATALAVDDPKGGTGTVPLLGIYRGRTLRFCANNRRLADLVVGCLSAQEPKTPPGCVGLVVDHDDSFSKDLADGFTRAIARAAPGARIDFFSLDGAAGEAWPRRTEEGFGPAERLLADRLWRASLDVPEPRASWVILPLQEAPTIRMLQALRGPGWLGAVGGGSRLRVLCGDSPRRETLQGLASTHDLPFPVWAASSASAAGARRDGAAVARLGARQIPAEIVSALLRCLDEDGGSAAEPGRLYAALAALDLKADDPAALGRPLAFDASGERRGEDFGRVLLVEPGRETLTEFTRQPSGRWAEAELPRPGAVAAPP